MNRCLLLTAIKTIDSPNTHTHTLRSWCWLLQQFVSVVTQAEASCLLYVLVLVFANRDTDEWWFGKDAIKSLSLSPVLTRTIVCFHFPSFTKHNSQMFDLPLATTTTIIISIFLPRMIVLVPSIYAPNMLAIIPNALEQLRYVVVVQYINDDLIWQRNLVDAVLYYYYVRSFVVST